MTDAEFNQFRDAMRKKYAVPIADIGMPALETATEPTTNQRAETKNSDKAKATVMDDKPDTEW